MKKRPRLIVYILINVIISAATILFVMWLWDRSRPGQSSLDESLATLTTAIETSTFSSGEPENELEPTMDPQSNDLIVAIQTIVGTGDLEIEYVEISNESQGSVDMSNWRLTDEDGQVFTFPTLILNQDGEIKVLSQKGINTVIELYWQSDEPIWESGETARLLDENGSIISTYTIP